MTGWQWPSPHQVLFGLVLLATLALGLHPHWAPPGSTPEFVLQMIMGIGGLLGIKVASAYFPDHVQAILKAHDDSVKDALAAMPPKMPTPLPPAAVLLFFGLLSLGACATPGGQAWGKCELGQLPQNSQTVIACTEGALLSPADWQAELTSCGASLLPGQLSCIVQAIIAATQGAIPAGHPKAGSGAQLIVERGQIWLNVHGKSKACGDRVHL
jgi:hypothetical protein